MCPSERNSGYWHVGGIRRTCHMPFHLRIFTYWVMFVVIQDTSYRKLYFIRGFLINMNISSTELFSDILFQNSAEFRDSIVSRCVENVESPRTSISFILNLPQH